MKEAEFIFSRQASRVVAPSRDLELPHCLLAQSRCADPLAEPLSDLPNVLPKRIGISLWQTHSWTKQLIESLTARNGLLLYQTPAADGASQETQLRADFGRP
jgi:hypothetical protein